MNVQKYKSQYTSALLEDALDTSAELEVKGIKVDAVDTELYFRKRDITGGTPVYSWEKIPDVVYPVVPVLENSDESLLADSDGNVFVLN